MAKWVIAEPMDAKTERSVLVAIDRAATSMTFSTTSGRLTEFEIADGLQEFGFELWLSGEGEC